MKFLLGSVVSFLALLAVACGGNSISIPEEAHQTQAVGEQSQGNANANGEAAASVPVDAAETNTIRIGDTVWRRSLPMTTGQCFVSEADGPLPTRATAWGTLNNDDDIRFAARHLQDGTFEAEVESDSYYWFAGGRSPGVDDLQIELDFDSLTITGRGTFTDFYTNESLQGAFSFQCGAEE